MGEEDGGLRIIEDGGWRMEDGVWTMEDGVWSTESRAREGEKAAGNLGRESRVPCGCCLPRSLPSHILPASSAT